MFAAHATVVPELVMWNTSTTRAPHSCSCGRVREAPPTTSHLLLDHGLAGAGTVWNRGRGPIVLGIVTRVHGSSVWRGVVAVGTVVDAGEHQTPEEAAAAVARLAQQQLAQSAPR